MLQRYRYIFALFTTCAVICGAGFVHAETESELRTKIADREAQVKALEAEITEYQKQIASTGKDISSLSSAIKNIDATIKKLNAQVKLQETKISATELRIKELEQGIGEKQNQITNNRQAIIDSLRALQETDGDTLIEIGLANDNYSDPWNDMLSLVEFGDKLHTTIESQKQIKRNLEDTRDQTTEEKKKLVAYKSELADQKKIADQAKAEKNKLLSASKSKDASYRKLMNDRIAKRDAVDKELLQYEADLRVILDKSAFPSAQKGILSWPLSRVVIAQYFGDTPFSRVMAALYNGQGHNGIDLDASIGTPIMAARGGIVKGVGDTDVTCMSASYGKWILIDHENGLSTLYAHLSLQKVSEGERVVTGQTIGYSGNTGYSTGPHLHFTLYATQGMQITSMKSRVVGCGTYRVPRAALNSYLNPLSYLP